MARVVVGGRRPGAPPFFRRGCMLPRHERLTRSGAFRAIFARGKAFRGRYVAFHYLPRSGGPSRMGVTAGKRVGGAVQRNRAKRVLREAFRALRGRLRVQLDAVLVAQPETGQAGTAKVQAELEKLMLRARILEPVSGNARAEER